MTRTGKEPNEENVAATRQAVHRKSVKPDRSSVLPSLSLSLFQICHLLQNPSIQRITHKNAEFKPSTQRTTAGSFEKLKKLITHADAIAYFNVKSKTRIVADASPIRLGVVLSQLHGSEWRLIGYASRRLSDVERQCSQTEKGALTLVSMGL